ncbi:WD40/YVTN/BNR-like repeat-containing protein [Ammoniphilus sp. 3BR4]|uniref:WD40/YVTN/BNR-like repeat-containing protein n=1 Tax=Ammoniphilus sp. 3BR4 TaxID=3158265 RepID=UPI003465D2A9
MIKTSWKKVTEGLFGGSATAVNITPKGTYILEADGNGIYRKEATRPWTLVKKTYFRHRHFYSESHSKLILTCGDKGSVLASYDDGVTWQQRNQGIPSTPLWTIIAINEKEWLTHTSRYLFYSSDEGMSWKQIDPFRSINGRKPEIRTIHVMPDGMWLLGTKIHPTLGGLWVLYDREWRLIKNERFSMIASINHYDNHILIATGSAGCAVGHYGYVKAINLKLKNILESEEKDWFTIENEHPQRGYLDIHSNMNNIYVAAYGDGSDAAQGGVFKISWNEKKMVPIGQKKGHIWRIAANEQDWISAGVHSVECSYQQLEWFRGFQNFNVADLIDYDGHLWMITSNEGILSTPDERSWKLNNEGIPDQVKAYQFQLIADKLFLETEKGVYVKEEDQWAPCLLDMKEYAKIMLFKGQLTLINKKGLWEKHNGFWRLLTKTTNWNFLHDAVSIGNEILILTDIGLLRYTPMDGWCKVPTNHEMVKLVCLDDNWLGITKEGKLYLKTCSGWDLMFPYHFKIFNILPYGESEIFICTNKGLFTASIQYPTDIKSVFVGPNISKAVQYGNKYYVSSYSNGLWTIT